MKKILTLLLLINVQYTFSQIEILSSEKLLEELTIFKNIRETANSGLYKYRTKNQIDSIYNWAFSEIKKPLNTIDFYKIICQLTDFEGSLHNETSLSNDVKIDFALSDGFFPFSVKLIQNNLVFNNNYCEIPLGSKIHKINEVEIGTILKKLNKYYTTDGYNLTGKSVGINSLFSVYYKYEFGTVDYFNIEYSEPFQTEIKKIAIKSSSNKKRYESFQNRHSKPLDSLYYSTIKTDKYKFEIIDKKTAILTINTFNIGKNIKAKEHKIYKKYLENSFLKLKKDSIKNLIVDIRNNGGGTDPNDILLFSYLTNKPFRENKSAFINFHKIPFINYLITNDIKLKEKECKEFESEIKNEFPNLINDKYFQNIKFNKTISPKKNAFNGNIYLLISERVASAGSLFASLVESNTNATTIGIETMGGYYGHNGHSSLDYKLPYSKIIITFSIVNLEQDVINKGNQLLGRGVIPDIYKSQTLEEFIKNEDNIIQFTLKTIEDKK